MQRQWTGALVLLAAALPGAAQQGAGAAQSHLGAAYRLQQDQLYEQAASEFEAALQLDPSLDRARYQLAICRFAVGQHEQARALFEQVRKKGGESAQVTYYLARLDLLALDYAAARRRLTSIVKQPPFPDTAFYLALAYIGEGDSRAALPWLRRAVALQPRDFRVHYRLARVCQGLGLEAEAKGHYDSYSRLRQEYQDGAEQARECSTALAASDLAAARPVCRRMFDPNDPDKLTLLGIMLGGAGAYEDSLEPLRLAARLDPESFEIWHNLGLSYFRMKRYTEAREPLEKAVALRRDFFGSNALLGAVLFTLGDDQRAYEVLDHAHRLNPADADTTRLHGQVARILGRNAFRAGNYAASVKYLRQAADAAPGDPAIQRELSEAAARAAKP